MEEIDVRMMAERIKALEDRVKTLEEKAAVPADVVYGSLLEDNALVVDKSRAAQLLGVTRATIYKMVRDGRLMETADSRIATRSIAEYIMRARGENNPYKPRGRKPGGTAIRA